MRRSIITLLLFGTVCLCSRAACGQPARMEQVPVRPHPDRPLRDRPVLPRARRDVWVNQYQPTSVEKKLIAPTAEDLQTFADALRQPASGLIKIFPAGPRRVVSLDQLESGQRPGFVNFASIYSFTKTKHGHGLQGYVDPRFGWAELKLENGILISGFTGGSVGLLVNLGDVGLETVTAATSGAVEIADFKPPRDYPEERHYARTCGAGFRLNGVVYRTHLPAAVNNTFVLRTISNKRGDLLVGFRVIREHEDGSLTLLWRKLKINPKPSWKKKSD